MIKTESGQAVVIVALLLVILFGFAAVGVDISAEVARGMKLQQAADAAALAGATAMAGGGDVTSNVDAFLQANSIPLSALASINTDQVNQTVTVTLAAPNPFYLAPVLGFATVTINRSATAKLGQGQSPFDYAVFSNEAINWSMSSFKVTGGIHSNASVYISISGSSGSYATNGIEGIGGVTINPNSGLNQSEMGPVNGNAADIPMPDLSSAIANEAQNELHYVTPSNWQSILPSQWNGYYDWSYDSKSNTFSVSGSDVTLADGTWYFNGNVSLYPGGWGTDINGTLFATGTISIGGGGLNENNSSNVLALYSQSSSSSAISLSISSSTQNSITGTLYAPNGTINLSGGVPAITGSVIANDITDSNTLPVVYTKNNTLSGAVSSIAYLSR